jgi:hypothetical protein
VLAQLLFSSIPDAGPTVVFLFLMLPNCCSSLPDAGSDVPLYLMKAKLLFSSI